MINTAGRSDRNSGKSSSPSKRRATTARPPTDNVARVNRLAATWDNDVAGRTTSPGWNSKAAAQLATIQPNVACVWVTPLGSPVLPEVKKMNAGASGGAAGSARVAGI